MTEVRGLLYVDPPVVEPYKFGLFGATQELPTDDPHWLHAGVEWESLAAYDAMLYPAGVFQGSGTGGDGGSKTLPNNLASTQAFPFAVYAGVDCGTIGRQQSEYEDRAREILALAEQWAVEDALWTGPQGNSPHLNATGTTTLTAATSVRAGVAALEQYLANNYNGRGVIHAPRSAAPYADWERQVRHVSTAETEDAPGVEHLETTLGTRWVFGGGYDGTGPAAVAPTAGKVWLYATGQLMIGRTDVIVPADFQHALNRTLNREFVIAERGYIVGVDGPIVAVQATLT